MAGGLRYGCGREMPPGMQELYGVKLAADMLEQGSTDPAHNEKLIKGLIGEQNLQPTATSIFRENIEKSIVTCQGGSKMTDEELITELRARSESIGADVRWLIDELIKRYRICKFEIETKKGV